MSKKKSESSRFVYSSKVRLKDYKTLIEAPFTDETEYEDQLKKMREEMSDRQHLLYAEAQRGLLIILQGMDTSGKDGVIKHVMNGLNPLGVEVAAFSSPSAEDKRHDFLWRTHTKIPSRGKIGIFNRSYYEEVLTVRVHPHLLVEENLPPELLKHPKKLWRNRLQDIANFESYLERQGIQVLKFFLNISFEEQKTRLLARIDDPDKNWKISSSDFDDRKLWPEFISAYEDCIEATHQDSIPWYIVPSDDKKTARLIVSKIINQTLNEMPLAEPQVTPEQRKKLKSLRGSL